MRHDPGGIHFQKLDYGWNTFHHELIKIISEPYTKILLDTAPETPGEQATLYIDIRSVLNLTCAVYSPEVPAAIFWKHNGKVKFANVSPGYGFGHNNHWPRWVPLNDTIYI